MILLPFLKDKTVFVLGLGVTGQACVEACLKSGAKVIAWDDKQTEVRSEILTDTPDWTQVDLFILSPGIPKSHRLVQEAKTHGIEPTLDINLLAQMQPKATFVGITGTNGKSTVTALIHHVLKETGYPVQMGGNIGTPALRLEPFEETGIYVLEMSSYQLELMGENPFSIGVLLNITPDHLEYHGSMEAYRSAKFRLFQNTKPGFFGVLREDLHAPEFGTSFEAKMRPEGLGEPQDYPHLPGAHNWENIVVSALVCHRLGLSKEEVRHAIQTFKGLPHRQEFVGKIGDIAFINDSKATNGDATRPALEAFDKIYWILGGQPKEGGIGSLKDFFPKVVKAYIIGEAQEEFSQTLEGQCDYELCGTLESAFEKAFLDSMGREGVVLLSPACASWDQFKSFEARGDLFKSLVAQKGAL